MIDHLYNQINFRGLPQNNSFKTELNLKENELIDLLSNIHPVKGASTFAGLLLCPELQSNCKRLEALVHVVLGYSKGHKKINGKAANKIFRTLKDTKYQYHEDPAEDVFISLVSTRKENYRIYNGIWKDSAFNLQRFIDIFPTWPDEELFNKLKDSSIALLKISEEIAKRMNHHRYILGEELPQDQIPEFLFDKLGELKKRIRFTSEDLEKLNIDPMSIESFIFNTHNFNKLLNIDLGSSPLESCPILYDGQSYTVILPTAISVAIRKYIYELLIQYGYRFPLEVNLAISYSNYFKQIPILGDLTNCPIIFHRKNDNDILISEVSTNIDVGRIIHLIFVLDNFQNHHCSWVDSYSPDFAKIGDIILSRIKKTRDNFLEDPLFKDGISLIVICGWGRPTLISFSRQAFDNWKIEHISASDLSLFSKIPNFKSLTLWRLLQAKDKIENLSINIQNISGLLNLYCWAESLNFHLIPHEHLPDENSLRLEILIEQNSFLKMKEKILAGWDNHIVKTNENEFVSVQKINIDDYFENDNLLSLYVSLSDINQKKLKSFIKSKTTKWWCSVNTDHSDKTLIYKIWEASSIWLANSIKVFDEYFTKLPDSIHWNLEFKSIEKNEINNNLLQTGTEKGGHYVRQY